MALLLLPITPRGTGAQAAPGQTAERKSPGLAQALEPASKQAQERQKGQEGQEDQVRRLIVLVPSRLETTTPQIQHGAEQEAKILSARKPRAKRRRRLFTLPGASRESAPSVSATPIPKTEKMDSAPKMGRDEKTVKKTPPNTVKDELSGAGKSGDKAISGGNRTNSAKSRPPDTVPVEQRTVLAQALFADMVAERVQERLGVAVAAQAEVSAAMNALRLTPADIEDRARPENGRRLCASLHCQAILIPHVTQCNVKDGLTRDATCYAQVIIAKINKTDKIIGALQLKTEQAVGKLTEQTGEKQRAGAPQKPETNGEGKLEPEGVSAAHWPARLDVAGSASSPQVLFHRQYQKPQGDLIRDAVQQAASLLVHALRTGEQAPFMRPADRLAVPPILAPTQADVLVFTKTGRRVQPSAARGLDRNVSGLFTPGLLPLSPDRILDASEILSRTASGHEPIGSGSGKSAGNLENLANLWQSGKNEILPDVRRVQSLGRRLGVDYVLLARITDVEVSEGAGDPATLVANTTPAAPERAVRAEAVAALVRVTDGTIQWQDRATSITTAPLIAQSAAGSTSAARALVHDTIRFALIELERRLRHYRADFEK